MTRKTLDEALREAAEALRDKKARNDELATADLSVTAEDVMVRQVIRSLEANGWPIVPSEVTTEMSEAARLTKPTANLLWRYMLAARPKPPEGA